MRSDTIPSPFQRVLSASFAAVLLWFGMDAQAHTFCVSTAAQLQSALNASDDGGLYDGESNFIYVETGTYTTGAASGNQAFHYTSTNTLGHLSIYGGYEPGCGVRTRNPSLTILDGQHATRVLDIHSTQPTVEVIGFTLQNGESTQTGLVAGGLTIDAIGATNGGVAVEDNIIQGNHSTHQYGGIAVYTANGMGLSVNVNLIVANSADEGYGAGIVRDIGGVGSFIHNTVAGNTTGDGSVPGGLYHSGGMSNFFIEDNIFWGNQGIDLYMNTANVLFEYNDYQTRGGVNAFVANIGNIQLDPKFVNPAAGNYRLQRTSPALAMEPSHTNLKDLVGAPYPLGGNGDAGVYEETVFKDGFGAD